MTKTLFSCVDAREKEYLDFFKGMIELESYTPDKADVDALGDYIRAFAEEHGFHVQTVPFEKAGNGLLITCNEGAPLLPVTFTGHMDTVHPKGTFEKPLFRVEDGKCFGPGVCDMKGGIVMGMLVMQAMLDAGYRDRPLKLVLIGDEELSEGLSGEAGKDFIRDSARGSAAAITLEGTGDESLVTVGRKGSIRYRVHVTGKASHAGSAYNKGISAIKEAAHKILNIEAASVQEQITYNCGLLKAGTAPNTVPENAEFTLYNRYWTMAQRQEIRDHVEGIIATSYIPGTVSTFEIIGERPPMEPAESNYALCEHINRVSQKYGMGEKKPYLKMSGSDAAYTTMAGAPSVCSMGPVGGGAHSTREFLDIGSIARRAKLVAAVVAELPEDFGK